jgi:hypothetical protein
VTRFVRPIAGPAREIYLAMSLLFAAPLILEARVGEPGSGFDIAPFALPGGPLEEIRFEETRDVVFVDVDLGGAPPETLGLSYLHDHWPQTRLEQASDLTQPTQFGWVKVDDWFNGEWKRARTLVTRLLDGWSRIAFQPLSSEYPEEKDYDVAFRRTLGLRLDGVKPDTLRGVRVLTRSPMARTALRIELNAGAATPPSEIGWDGYNARVRDVRPVKACRTEGSLVRWEGSGSAIFEVVVDHMIPTHRYSGDDGHVRFILAGDAFTISLVSLESQGPIWYAEKGVFITRADDATTFEAYRARNARARTIAQRVKERPEQSYAGAFRGQPRPHAAAWSLGFKNCRQRFWQDPNGDITLESTTVRQIPASDTSRYANGGGHGSGWHGRFFFGLEDWILLGRSVDPAPALASVFRARKDDVELELVSFAAPLDGLVDRGVIAGDRDLVCLSRFRLKNVGDGKRTASVHLEYSSASGRSPNPYARGPGDRSLSEWLVPRSPREKLSLVDDLIRGDWNGRHVIRARAETSMSGRSERDGITFERELIADESCELLLKIPFIALDSPSELEQLRSLAYDSTRKQLAGFWRAENARGARIRTPVPQLDALHLSHLTHVQISDPAMPGEPGLINTSVGTSTYSNCGNESCMINQELDQRGLVDDARRRLEVWLKYQGTEPLIGRFSDKEGVLHGAGSFTFLASYNQNHGWILWRLAEHFLYTRDRAWIDHASPAIVAACDWVFRQRKHTLRDQPFSRGWEYGFMPAGALEDVAEYRYWLTTNAMIWRGVDTAAKALEAAGHPEAARIRREADAYGKDLKRGFETMRQHSPLVRLRDGRWVPYYPSQLYRRGRDVGWIRETLEGSVYLLISGLYDPRGREAQWILDDFQDNRYMSPPYGYAIVDEDHDWFGRGGISIQPNLLAGLMPYLDRDEPELYLWMFFNAWAACYREEINAMVEHPYPVLGYANTAHPKTSDEANAVMWLRYLFVYGPEDGLYLGRAVPRAWLAQREPSGLEDVGTRWGRASVKYFPAGADGTITVRVDLRHTTRPPKTVIRFRHPEGKPVNAVTINGREHRAFDTAKGDVDISDQDGAMEIVARF